MARLTRFKYSLLAVGLLLLATTSKAETCSYSFILNKGEDSEINYVWETTGIFPTCFDASPETEINRKKLMDYRIPCSSLEFRYAVKSKESDNNIEERRIIADKQGSLSACSLVQDFLNLPDAGIYSRHSLFALFDDLHNLAMPRWLANHELMLNLFLPNPPRFALELANRYATVDKRTMTPPELNILSALHIKRVVADNFLQDQKIKENIKPYLLDWVISMLIGYYDMERFGSTAQRQAMLNTGFPQINLFYLDEIEQQYVVEVLANKKETAMLFQSGVSTARQLISLEMHDSHWIQDVGNLPRFKVEQPESYALKEVAWKKSVIATLTALGLDVQLSEKF